MTALHAPGAVAQPPRRDPLDVPADVLRQRIRLALSLLGHRSDCGEQVRQVLTGEVGVQ